MTFTEAARAVLERERRPMHSREIAEMAVELGILSHVGKTPVQTMSARLSAAVSKGDPSGTTTFVRMRPGVFALSEWEGKAPSSRKADSKSAQTKAPRSSKSQKATPTPMDASDSLSQTDSRPGEKAPTKHSEPKRATEASGGGADEAQIQRKKKRRRRKKRPEESESSLETIIPAATTVVTQPKAETKVNVPRATSSPSQGPAPMVDSSPSQAPGPNTAPPPSQAPGPVKNRQDQRKPNGYSLVDRIEYVLRRQNKPVQTAAIAEQIGRGGENGATLVEALIVADALDRETRGLRPRFTGHKKGFTLSEREVSGEVLHLEQQIADVRERLVKIAEKQLLRKLRSLSMKAFIRIMAIHLQRSGFEALVPVSRNRKEEFHLSVQDRRHAGRFRTALVIRRDNIEQLVSETAVFDLRGSLHHYGASSGLIATTGAFSEQAKVEARVPNLHPIALIDGDTLCKEMVRLGIGVRDRTLSLPSFDDGFFLALED